MDLPSLIRKRGHLKASLTRLTNWVNVNKDCTDKYAFLYRIDSLDKYFEEYNEIQGKIEEQDEHESADRLLTEERYFSIKCVLKNSYDQLTSVPAESKITDSNATKQCSIRLPSIEIPIFTGDITKYTQFIELFTALIINNPNLNSNTQKFYYLLSYLQGEPKALISQLTVSDQNFSVALDLLEQRYFNVRQIVYSHFLKLLNVNSITKCAPNVLRQFVAESKANLNSLLNLNIDKEDLFDALIVYMLKNKLDFNSKKSLEEKHTGPDLITLNQFFEFIEQKCITLENISSPDKPESFSSSQKPSNSRVSLVSNQIPITNNGENNATPRMANLSLSGSGNVAHFTQACTFCNEQTHRIYTCPQFGNLNVYARKNFIKDNNFCSNCLGKFHSNKNCRSQRRCAICGLAHHILLHLNERSAPRNVALNSMNRTPSGGPSSDRRNNNYGNTEVCNNSATPISRGSEATHAPKAIFDESINRNISLLNIDGSHVLLATCNILVFPLNAPPIRIRALLDPGSQSSFICEGLVEFLNIKKQKFNMSISGIGNLDQTVNSMAELEFYSPFNEQMRFNTTCAIVKQITCPLPQVFIEKDRLPIPSKLLDSLSDPHFGITSDVHILLGAEIYYDLLAPGMHNMGKNLPSLINTHLGWVISGVIPPFCLPSPSRTTPVLHSFLSVNQGTPTQSLDSAIEKFWNQEELSHPKIMSDDDIRAEETFVSSLQVLPNGHFSVNLPLVHNDAHTKLGDSFVMAKNRFISLEKKLNKDMNLKSEYRRLLFEYVSLGHGQIMPLTLQNEFGFHKYFVPHLCVHKLYGTTQVRIVFDFSAVTTTGISLNAISLKGPRCQPELVDILVRFRNYRYVLTADVTKMYRQVEVSPDYRFLQNVLWRDSPEEPFICIQLNTVSFGQASASYLATRALNEVAFRNPKYFDVQNSILKQTYVDDILTGTNDINELEPLYNNLNNALSKFGFQLHKFCSNVSDFSTKHSFSSSVLKDLNLEHEPSKVLGINWNPTEDTLLISTPSLPLDESVTKRKILSIISQCYDPLGIINSVIMKGKLIMQQVWLAKLPWDEIITDTSILKNWCSFLDSISKLASLQIPRYTFLAKNILHIELHGFCDASTKAYGACVYLRAVYTDCTASSRLIIAKSRVAPLNKPLTVPKLELCAMVLLVSIYDRLRLILKDQINLSGSFLWSDSQVSLSWLRSTPTRWAVFVCNRVAQIHVFGFAGRRRNRGAGGKKDLKEDMLYYMTRQ